MPEPGRGLNGVKIACAVLARGVYLIRIARANGSGGTKKETLIKLDGYFEEKRRSAPVYQILDI